MHARCTFDLLRRLLLRRLYTILYIDQGSCVTTNARNWGSDIPLHEFGLFLGVSLFLTSFTDIQVRLDCV